MKKIKDQIIDYFKHHGPKEANRKDIIIKDVVDSFSYGDPDLFLKDVLIEFFEDFYKDYPWEE